GARARVAGPRGQERCFGAQATARFLEASFSMKTFQADIEEIRRRAREKMEMGPITGAYQADREKVISVLNEVLATEIVCTLRYRSHYFMAQGIHSQSVADEFLEHANDEQMHADQVAKRITELNGVPNFDPFDLRTRSHAEYKQV